MLDAVWAREGVKLLDAGCGSGEAAAMAVGRGAHVTGLDAAAQMIELARQNASGVEFTVGDLESMPYANGQFDAVIASNSVHFCNNHARAVGEIARVTRKGGRIAICSMGEYKDMDIRKVMFSPAFALLSGPPPANPFALSNPGALEDVVTGAGLRIVMNLKVGSVLRAGSFGEAWTMFRSVGPIAHTIKQVGEDAVRNAVHDAAVKWGVLKDNGEIMVRDWHHVVVAVVP
jgi:SAM-dependent methyltransferase